MHAGARGTPDEVEEERLALGASLVDAGVGVADVQASRVEHVHEEQTRVEAHGQVERPRERVLRRRGEVRREHERPVGGSSAAERRRARAVRSVREVGSAGLRLHRRHRRCGGPQATGPLVGRWRAIGHGRAARIGRVAGDPGAPADGPGVDRIGDLDPVRRQLDAFEAATLAIAQELSLERVLQLIVDRVRPLVGARYAALGIADETGRMARFITSGVDEATRRAIGPPPRGLGLLGAIIREGRTMRLPDLGADPRSVGFPANHPPMRSFLGVPIRVEDRAVGNLYLTEKIGGDFDRDDERLVETFARHAGLAIHNARLHEQLSELAILQERERIAQDLHDGSIQSLYAVSLSLEETAEIVAGEADASERIDRAIDAIHETIRGIREFITGLTPGPDAADDLETGLASLADDARRTGLDVTVEADASGARLEPETCQQLIQLAREALSNVVRHARASAVRLRVEHDGGTLRLSISDDGVGFDPTVDPRPGHHGLGNMRARAEGLGGRLVLESHEGAGTSVRCEIPAVRPAILEEAPR